MLYSNVTFFCSILIWDFIFSPFVSEWHIRRALLTLEEKKTKNVAGKKNRNRFVPLKQKKWRKTLDFSFQIFPQDHQQTAPKNTTIVYLLLFYSLSKGSWSVFLSFFGMVPNSFSKVVFSSCSLFYLNPIQKVIFALITTFHLLTYFFGVYTLIVLQNIWMQISQLMGDGVTLCFPLFHALARSKLIGKA